MALRVKKISLLCFGCILGVGLLEIFFRVFLPQKTFDRLPRGGNDCFLPHAVYYVELRQNADCQYGLPSSEYDTTTHLNNLGMRDNRDYKLEKSKETRRILFLGDSYTFGMGLSGQEAYPKQAEKQLQEKGYNVEVWNGAAPGVDLTWSYLVMKRNLDAFDPDMVVVGMYLGNDLYDFDYFQWEDIGADGLPGKISTPFEYVDSDHVRRSTNISLRYRLPFFRNSHALIFVTEKLFGPATFFFGNPGRNGSVCMLTPDCDEDNEYIRKAQMVIEGMKRLVDEKRIPLIFGILPWEGQLPRRFTRRSDFGIVVTDDTRRHHLSDEFERFLQDKQIAFVDVLTAFDEYQGEEQVFYPKDTHWTGAGHQVAAGAFVPVISGVLDELK